MKHKISPFIVSVFCLFLFAVSVSAYSMGDIDGNGTISAMDARTALRAAAYLETLSSEQAQAADVDGNGKVTSADARMILRVAASLDTFKNSNDSTDAEPPTQVPPATETPTVGPDTELSAKDVHKIALQYTVEVYAILDDTYMSAGSGFFISEDGQLVTNYHVIEGAKAIYIVDCNGETAYVSDILAYDANTDLAILKVNIKSVAAVVNNNTPETGDTIYTLGNSAGAYYDTFTNGIVSNASRVVENYNPDMTYIQMTAPITHGNSGGPLINSRGEVIGINTWGDTSGQNLNFAIPIRYLANLDLSNPMTMEEFAGGGGSTSPIPTPTPDPDDEILVLNPVINLKQGGTAAVYLSFENVSEYSITPVCVRDTDYVSTEWSDWYGDVIVLFVSGLRNTSLTQIEVYVEENPAITATIDVSISYSGSSVYLGEDVDFPDFGAYSTVAPMYWSLSEDGMMSTYVYYLDDLFAAGLDSYDIVDGFFAMMESYGFYAAYEDDTYSMSTIIFDSYYYYDVSMSYSLLYDDYGEVYAIMIGLHYY